MGDPRLLVVAPDRRHATLRFPPAGLSDVLDYGFDFAPWLAMAPDDAIEGIAASVATPASSATVAAAPKQNGTAVTIRVGPATAGTCQVTVTIATTQGRRKSATAMLPIIPPA